MTWLRVGKMLMLSPLLVACSSVAIIEYSSDSVAGQEESTGSGGSSESGGAEGESESASGMEGDGDGDPSGDGDGPGDGDGDPSGDGDGDPSGDGDGEPGDGDGDPLPDPVCGNGVLEGPGEECDGDSFGNFSCLTFDFIGGTLLCTEDCSIDTSECLEEPCGNGVLEGNEECDEQNFGGVNCIDLGEGPGALTCTDVCTFDVGECGIEGEGEGCVLDANCPDNNLYCAFFICYDGSLGDPCSSNGQCISDDCDEMFGIGECV